MITLQGVTITLLAGPGKAAFECFEPACTQRGAEVVRAELNAPICPHIRIEADFDWNKADFLCVKTCYGTDMPMKSHRIFKPAVAAIVEMDLDSWKVWDAKRFEWREATFKFCDLEYTREPSERWSESKRLSIGTICISLQRMTLGDNSVKYVWPETKFEPTLKLAVILPRNIADFRSIAKSVKVDKSENFDMGSETRLEGLIGNWFNFRFNYRSESYLQTQSLEPLNPPVYLTSGTQDSQEAPGSIVTSTEHEPLGRGHRRKFKTTDGDERGGSNASLMSNYKSPHQTKRVIRNRKHSSLESNLAPMLKPGQRASNPNVTKDKSRDRSSSFELSDARRATLVASSSSIGRRPRAPPVPKFLTIPVTRAERIQELKDEEYAVDEMILQQLLNKKAKLKHEREQLEALQTTESPDT